MSQDSQPPELVVRIFKILSPRKSRVDYENELLAEYENILQAEGPEAAKKWVQAQVRSSAGPLLWEKMIEIVKTLRVIAEVVLFFNK